MPEQTNQPAPSQTAPQNSQASTAKSPMAQTVSPTSAPTAAQQTGQKSGASPGTPGTQPQPGTPGEVPGQKKSRWWLWIILVLGVVILVGLLAYFIF